MGYENFAVNGIIWICGWLDMEVREEKEVSKMMDWGRLVPPAEIGLLRRSSSEQKEIMQVYISLSAFR